MAHPGFPLNSRSQGCNQLIRDGAVLVQSPEDVVELLVGFDGTPQSRFTEQSPGWIEDDERLDDSPAEVEALLGIAPVAIDELIRQSGGSPSAVQLALLELEIAGRLVRHAGGRVSLGS